MEVLGFPGQVIDGDPDYSQILSQMAGEALSSPGAFRLSEPAIPELEQRAAVNFAF